MIVHRLLIRATSRVAEASTPTNCCGVFSPAKTLARVPFRLLRPNKLVSVQTEGNESKKSEFKTFY